MSDGCLLKTLGGVNFPLVSFRDYLAGDVSDEF